MLDHTKTWVKAGPGRLHAWVSDGTVTAIALTSKASQIWISVHSAATRICNGPTLWFSNMTSVGDNCTSAIAHLPSFLPASRVTCSAPAAQGSDEIAETGHFFSTDRLAGGTLFQTGN